MEIGFTGTLRGGTDEQLKMLYNVMQGLRHSTTIEAWFHHGDCVGADAQAHKIAVELKYKVALHPPDNPARRAWCKADYTYPELPYLERNQVIVETTRFLLAAPYSREMRRSGTWTTVRKARLLVRPILIINRDGSACLETDNEELLTSLRKEGIMMTRAEISDKGLDNG